MESIISSSVWTWLSVIVVWCVCLTLIDMKFFGYGRVTLFGFLCCCIVVLCAILSAVFGTIVYLEWRGAWPFTPS